jgi:hypothetical protein
MFQPGVNEGIANDVLVGACAMSEILSFCASRLIETLFPEVALWIPTQKCALGM